MADEFNDVAYTTLAAAIDADDTTIDVVDGSGFDVPFYGTLAENESNPATVTREIVRVTAKPGANQFTVTRNADGKGAQSFGAGAKFEQRITSLSLDKYEAAADDADAALTAVAGHLADTSAAHEASAIAFTPAGDIAATDVQAAIEEVAAEAGGGGMVIGDPVTSGTAGSVLFVGAGGVLAQDNAGISFDPATDALTLHKLALPSVNSPTSPTLQFGDGDTGFYEITDDTLQLSMGGTPAINFGSFSVYSASGNRRPLIWFGSNSSATTPAYRFNDDGNTGMGSSAADTINLIAGGSSQVIITTTGLGFYGKTPVNQPAGISDADGTLASATSRVNAVIAALESLGLIATV